MLTTKPITVVNLSFLYLHCPTRFQNKFYILLNFAVIFFFPLNVLHHFPIAVAAMQPFATNLGVKRAVRLLVSSVPWAFTGQNMHAALSLVSNGDLGTKVLASYLPLLKLHYLCKYRVLELWRLSLSSPGQSPVQSEGTFAIIVTVPSRVLTPTM